MRSKEEGFLGTTVCILVGLVVVAGLIWWGISSYGNWIQQTSASVTIKVTDKTRAFNNNSNEDQYLIFTDDEVFENTDSWWHNKYNSSDLYGQLKVGKTYQCDVFGERNPRWSWYRNLISCTEKS